MTRLLVVLSIAALAACQRDSSGAPPPKPKPVPATPKPGLSVPHDAAPDYRAMDGAHLYAALCAQCHGADGKGYVADHAPSLVTTTFLASASDDFLRRSIASGRPGTAMAAYGAQMSGPLDEAGLAKLVMYLRSLGPAPQQLPAAGGGDAANGAKLYAQHCLSCHGDAKTRGEGPMLANPQFQAAATDSFIRYAIAQGRPDTKMAAWGAALGDKGIDDLVIAVRQLAAPNVPEVTLLPEPTDKDPLVINPTGKAPSFTLKDDKFVGVDQLAKALAEKRRVIVIDARPPSDWRRVHVTGAVSIPYHQMKRLDEVPTDGTWVVAYCACPHHLSGIVIDELRRRGFKNTAVLDEGILEWHRRGYPVVHAQGVEPPPKEPPLPAGTIR